MQRRTRIFTKKRTVKKITFFTFFFQRKNIISNIIISRQKKIIIFIFFFRVFFIFFFCISFFPRLIIIFHSAHKIFRWLTVNFLSQRLWKFNQFFSSHRQKLPQQLVFLFFWYFSLFFYCLYEYVYVVQISQIICQSSDFIFIFFLIKLNSKNKNKNKNNKKIK